MASSSRRSLSVRLVLFALCSSCAAITTQPHVYGAMHARPRMPACSLSLLDRFDLPEMKSAADLQKVASPVAFGLSYFAVELSFFSVALPIGYVAWHAATGEWLQPLLLLQDGGNEDKARLLGLVASYIVLLKTLFPLRLGATLLLTPRISRLTNDTGNLLGGVPLLSSARTERRRRALKDELRELACSSRGGLDSFSTSDQQRFDETVAELSTICPTIDPASSQAFTGTWNCLWTSEEEVRLACFRIAACELIRKRPIGRQALQYRSLCVAQINVLVRNGLFGLPWERTYQTVDVASGSLENVIEFAEGGYLRVGSTLAPDAQVGRRFNFSFERCTLCWRGIELPLPPVGRGWGELLYIDEELRVQRDVRGALLVAQRQDQS